MCVQAHGRGYIYIRRAATRILMRRAARKTGSTHLGGTKPWIRRPACQFLIRYTHGI